MKDTIFNILMQHECESSSEINAIINSRVDYFVVSKKVDKLYDKLCESLTEEQKEDFDDFIDLECDMTAIEAEEYFKTGLKSGVRIMSQCLSD